MNTNSAKIFSWKAAILLSIGVGLLTAGSTIALQTHGLTVSAKERLADTPVLSATATTAVVGKGVSYEIPGMPVRLIIPSIGVDANIQSVGLSWRGTGDMGVPTNFTDVGWYKYGPMPGVPGSAVIDGHLDGKNVREAVFYNLDKLTPGDIVQVLTKGGKTLKFRVTGIKTYDSEAPTAAIFAGDNSKAHLNLITCAGDWDKTQKSYNKRIVVFTEMVQE